MHTGRFILLPGPKRWVSNIGRQFHLCSQCGAEIPDIPLHLLVGGRQQLFVDPIDMRHREAPLAFMADDADPVWNGYDQCDDHGNERKRADRNAVKEAPDVSGIKLGV